SQHEIETTELGQSGPYYRLHGIVIPHVRLPGHDAPSGLLYQLDGFLEVFWCRQRVLNRFHLCAQVQDDDVRAFLGHQHRVRASLAPGSAGDECDFAVKPSHQDPSSHFSICESLPYSSDAQEALGDLTGTTLSVKVEQ